MANMKRADQDEPDRPSLQGGSLGPSWKDGRALDRSAVASRSGLLYDGLTILYPLMSRSCSHVPPLPPLGS